ncbi:MAG: SDR family oxidoreductase [Anaerolineales bacterium]|nr:SDR family oxidoreductase [Anaerolineales bacterium]
MDLGLSGKVALVTAASKGLGKASAIAIAREGAKLVINARSEALEVTAEEIRKETDAQILTVRGDLTQQAHINGLVQAALDEFGQIDILFVNSGGPPPGDFLTFKPEDWEAAFNLTLMSAVRLCYAVVPHMLERGEGSIITAQSISVKQPIDNLILSNSLRMAVIGLFKSLANELGPKGIRVNSINPTFTWTERVENLLKDRAKRSGTSIEDEAAQVSTAIPLKRMGTVEEFGKAVAWLASPAASYIHGHALMFDGGMTKSAL